MDQTASAPTEAADPSGDALQAALPEIRRAKTNGIALSVLAIVVAFIVAWIATGLKKDAVVWSLMSLVVGAVMVGGIGSWVRGQHERAVMPIIAQAFGLSYQKSLKTFYDRLPKNFIPLGGRRSVDDMMSGTVADRRFSFAECKTETGGKNSSTLFRGVVLEAQSKPGMPEFIIASEKETKGFLFFKGHVQVDGMVMVHSMTGPDGQIYGLWATSEDPSRTKGLRMFMDKILALGPRVLGQSSLYSLVSTGSTYYVSLRHSRDLFKIGGMFASEAQVMTDIRAAATEFGYPVRLVTEILRAEEALVVAS